MTPVSLLGAALAVLLSVVPAALRAHSGHDHGALAPAAPPIAADLGFGAEGSAFQAVLTAAEDGATLVLLADADSNAPVGGAAIEAEAGDWRGKAEPTAAEGVYRLAWLLPVQPADMTLVVTAAGRDDLLLLSGVRKRQPASPAESEPPVQHWRHWVGGGLLGALGLAGLAFLARRRPLAAWLFLLAASPALAHSGHDHGAPEPAAVAPAPGQSLSMAKATQFLLGIRTEKAEARAAAETLRVVGRVVPDPAGYARVQPAQPTRVAFDPAYPFPVPGQRVKRGDVLIALEPTLTAIERSDKRAALSRIEGDIAIQERDLARFAGLGDAVAPKTVETARIRLEQLRKERAQIAGTALGRELVAAPVDGVVTDVHVVPGEVVAPNQVLVEIVDPGRLRVEAVIHDLAAVDRVTGARAASRQFPDRAFPLEPLGSSPRVDPQDQGVHMHFAVKAGEGAGLRIGMPVDVYLSTGAARLSIAVPRDAVVESGGRPVVFLRTAPEAFEARPVKVGRIIGPLIEIEAGLAAGDRVVVQGAGQLRAAR